MNLRSHTTNTHATDTHAHARARAHRYELYAILSHSGTALGGHYYAYAGYLP
jgi:ubiquitin C-terminal hydrolase